MEFNNIKYNVIKSKRNTICLEVKKDCTVVVRCPLSTLDKDIKAIFIRKENWIKSNIKKIKEIKNIYKTEGNKLTYEQIANIMCRAKKVIPNKVHMYAQLLGVSFNSIRIKKQKTCWGSCSQKGNLNFNCLLMLMPERVIDYVIVHELCHRKEMNHSYRFWNEVKVILPDYKCDRKWLKDNGDRIMARMY